MQPRSAAVALVLALAGGIARADETDPNDPSSTGPPVATPEGRSQELELDWRIHAAVILVGGAGWIASEALFKESLAPGACRWCGTNDVDSGVRDALRWHDTERANRWSNIFAYGVVPAGAFGFSLIVAGHDRRMRNWPIDALVVLEAMVLAADLNQTAKFLIGRQRPYVANRVEGEPLPEDNLSFYSGHTSFTFSLAAAAGTVSTIRGYRLTPAVWALGATAAAATGYLRIAADRHYASDVLTGAVVGAAVGVAVPLLLRTETVDDIQGALTVVPTAGGAQLAWAQAW
jgi:membrane-associated phospholipid phosphatase